MCVLYVLCLLYFLIESRKSSNHDEIGRNHSTKAIIANGDERRRTRLKSEPQSVVGCRGEEGREGGQRERERGPPFASHSTLALAPRTAPSRCPRLDGARRREQRSLDHVETVAPQVNGELKRRAVMNDRGLPWSRLNARVSFLSLVSLYPCHRPGSQPLSRRPWIINQKGRPERRPLSDKTRRPPQSVNQK